LIAGILILVLLILLSAFFSGIESAFISLSEIDLIEIEHSTSKNRKILLRLLEKKERLLSTILIGNNLVNIAASALNTALAIQYAPRFGMTEELGVTVSAIVLVLVILIFGEITPKNIALGHNRKISLFVSPLIFFLTLVFTPPAYFIELISGMVSWIFKGKRFERYIISEKTVINVVSRGEKLGVINKMEQNLIQNVFLFDEREVYPIMTPRTEVFALNEELTIDEVKKDIMLKQFSRIPVFKESIDNITGIVNIKTIFREFLEGEKDVRLKELAQKPIFVYETQTLSILLERFKQEQSHIAVIVDEFGGMAGIVTLEDILEELVGEIFDEKDIAIIESAGENKWIINEAMDIVTVNKTIKGEIKIDGDYETLQGLIMSNLNRIPKPDDKVKIPPHHFKVLKMNRNKIQSILIEYHLEEDKEVKSSGDS